MTKGVAGIAMVLRGPHKRMKIAGVGDPSLGRSSGATGFPTPGLRPRIGVRGMLSTGGVTSWESIFL